MSKETYESTNASPPVHRLALLVWWLLFKCDQRDSHIINRIITPTNT